MAMKIEKSAIPGVFWLENGKKHPATINLVPGIRVYGEKLVTEEGIEYREWDPYRSKIGAAIMRSVDLPIKAGDKVLYLGVASGTTASHVSDIVGAKGKVYGVDIAERTMRDFIFVAEKRKNLLPILSDAQKPENYMFVGTVDFVFADVAMPNQTEILIRNCDAFLKKGGYAMISVKARSIDVNAKPSDIFAEEEVSLKQHFEIIDKKRLEPYEKDHIIFLLKKAL